MGAASSSGGVVDASNPLAKIYAAYDNKVVPQMMRASLSPADVADLKGVLGAGEFLGGGASCLGGYDALQDYGNSLFSKAKEKLIREIAEEVFSALKISGAKNAKTAPISDVVAHLKKLSPNPAKGKRFNESFNSSSGKQKAVCHALANAINSNYGGRIINMEASDSEMCNQVAEVMYSLLTGLHTEFLNVAGDVTRIMKNMQVVEGALTSAYNKQVELVNASGDARLKEQSQNSAKLYGEIKAEYDRQAAILANLMNVSIGPSGKSLITALEDNRDFAGLVRDLKAEAGTTAFGDKLAHLLSGISTVAHSAELIDKALRKIGMSVGEFKSAKNAGELRARVLSTIMKDSPNSKELDEMMAAAQIIFNNNYDHDAISKLLNGSAGKKGRGESFGGDAEGGDPSDDEKEGAAEGGEDVLPTYWQKKSLSKKIENKTKYRDLVLKDFRKLLKSHYQQVVDAAVPLSNKVGRAIPVSDQLDYFVRAFSELPNLDRENLHIALSGYAKDSVSKEKREQFMNSYLLLDQAIDPLTKGPEGSLFKNLQVSVRGMVKSIDEFSDKMVKALTEIHVDNPDEIQSALKKSANLFYGSGDSGDDLFGSGSWVAFDKVKNEMRYFYSIANIKTNMGRFADDIKTYSDDYEQLLGEEAGWLINTIKKEFIELINFTDPTKEYATFPDPKPADTSRAGVIQAALRAFHAAGDANKPVAVLAHKNLVKLWTMQMNAKENMVKVAQAVDLYLKSFTDGIARQPDAVSSIVKMLDQVDIVARWFNDKSGDNLSYLFEMFPHTVSIKESAPGGPRQPMPEYSYGDGANAPVKVDGSFNNPTKAHYYEYVEEQTTKANLPGNPFLGRPLGKTEEKQFDSLVGLAEKAIKGMRALENILSAFASVGSKFGDLDPQAHTFMNPGQIFNALVEYIKASAFTTQFAPVVGNPADAAQQQRADELTAAIYHSRSTMDTVVTEGFAPKPIPSIAREQHRPTARNAGIQWSQSAAADRARTVSATAGLVGDVDAGKRGILTGVHTESAAPIVPAHAPQFKYQSMALSAIPYDSDDTSATFWKYHDFGKREDRLDAAGWQDAFYDTDLLFQMTVKSIVSKIFTVVDAYRLFNRPTVNRELSYSLNPLRTIIGGSAKPVKIVPEAAELYLRLPLLAEWYREMYGFKSDATPANLDNWKLSIVPSIDGTWSEFIGIIFDKAREVKEGNYTESQAQAMIVTMNDIYKSYKTKYPKATIRNIINSFVLEMNRIFGFLKQKEINAYINQRREFLKGNPEGDKEDFIDYDILNANDQFGSRPAPSDKFVNVGLKTNNINRISMQKLQSEVVTLRARMDADFNRALVSNTDNTNPLKPRQRVSFIETLKNYKKELEVAKDDVGQYQIVLQMIQGSNKSVNLSADKLIMVHEAVAVPLALIYGVYKVLFKYNSLVHGASIPNIADWNTARANVASAGPIRIQLDNNTHVRTAYRAFLETKYDKILATSRDLMLDGMVNALAGNIADAVINATNCGYVVGKTANVGGQIVNTSVDAPHLMQDLLNALADLSINSGKLVSCSVGTGGNINVDFSPLQDMCVGLLSQVKSNIQKLRTSFPPDSVTVSRYENNSFVGSTRWLEENLMEILFNDRDQCGLSTGYSSHLTGSLKRLMVPGNRDTIITMTSGFETVDNALRGLIYYEFKQGVMSLSPLVAPCEINKFPWNVIPMKKTADDAKEKELLSQSSNNGVFQGADEGKVNGLFAAPIIYFDSNDTINNFNVANKIANGGPGEDLQYNSLLTRFNKLVHMYLYTNLEEGALKIYTPLFESFMNGAASREVLQNKSFPNVGKMLATSNSNTIGQNARTGQPEALQSPPDSTVLYASTSMAMRALATSVAVLGTVQKKKHAYDNIAEIPEFLKDRMRVNLPYFSKLFQEVNERADFLKRVLSYTDVNKNITSCVTAFAVHFNVRNNGQGVDLKEMYPNGGAPLTSAKNTEYLNGLLTRFIELSGSIKKCCDSVYKELNDKPVPFLETSKDFIADYKRKNGVLPLMPVSSLLTPMGVINRRPNLEDASEISQLMLPVATNGSNTYKFNSAAKLILSDLNTEPNIDHFPGAKEIYNMYSEAVDGNTLTSAEYANTIKLVAKLARFLNTGVLQARMYGRPQRSVVADVEKHNCGSVFGSRWEAEYTTDVSAVANPSERNFAIAPLVKTNLAAIIELTENSNTKHSKENLAQIVGAKVSELRNDLRADLRTFNILDMNIVPINVHAFMREIPFVNILNYAYTFDRMVHDFVLPSYVKNLGSDITPDNIMIKANSDVTNPRELLVKLLAHPYADLGAKTPQYFGLLASLFNGNDDMKLGRPRYLSDQLWHKALLTSSVQLGYGNSATIANLPAVANTNTALGPAGYESQRGAVTSTRRSKPMSADITKKIFNFIVTHSSAVLANAAVLKAVVMSTDTAPIPPIVPDDAYTLVTGGAFDRAGVKVAIQGITDLANDGDVTLARDMQMPLTPDIVKLINAFNTRVQVVPNDQRRDRRTQVHSLLGIMVRKISESIIARSNRIVCLGNAAREINDLVGLGEFAESKDVTDYLVSATNGMLTTDLTVSAAPLLSLNPRTPRISEGLYTDRGNFVVIEAACASGVRAVRKYCAFVRRIGIDISEWLEDLMLVYLMIAQDNTVGNARAYLGYRTINSLLAVGAKRSIFTYEDYLASAVLESRQAGAPGAIVVQTLDFISTNAGGGVLDGVYSKGVLDMLSVFWKSLGDMSGVDSQKLIEHANLELIGDPVQAEGLKYRKNDRWAVANTGGKNMDVGNVVYCAELGRMRFDTKLVRNLTWLVQLQRIMRVVLINHLSWINTPVIRGLKIVDPKVTEYESNDKFDEDDYNGNKYSMV